MALSLPDVVRRFKADVAQALSADWIERACASIGYSFRQRLLDPVTTVHLFLLQILHGNIACAALPHLSGLAFSAAAYSKARLRLPLELFEDLLQRVVDALFCERQTTGLWQGHRTWLLDGSSFSMPDTPELQAHFGQPGGQRRGCGFPVAHILALFHAGTGFLQRVVAAPLRTHDMAGASQLHGELSAGDVLVADRGFASFAHLALLWLDHLHAVFRCHQKQIVNFRPGRRHRSKRKPQRGQPGSRWLQRLGRHDQLVEYRRPSKKPVWLDQAAFDALPLTLTVRELRYRVRQRGRRTRVITLVTTLLDPFAYPATALAELYQQRWQVEIDQADCRSSGSLYLGGDAA